MTHTTDVYFNLHRRLWSLLTRATQRVDTHAQVVIFDTPVAFVVRAAGRAAVLRNRQKTVHAFVRGSHPHTTTTVPDTSGMVPAGYNPYTHGYFTRRDTGERVDGASRAVLIARPNAAPELWIAPA